MITTQLIPVATATSQEMLVEITERVCHPFCINATAQPSASVVFTVGTARVVNSNAIVPVTAKVTVVTPDAQSGSLAKTQVFTETFDIAFEAATTNAVTLVPGADIVVTPARVKCCVANGVKLITTLTATIA